MKTALACIAKNEDHYIDEWLHYNLKLGFDTIFVYQNDWRYAGDKAQYGSSVVWFDFDGKAKQQEQLNNFIKYHQDEFDWGACFDIDEFLVLKHSPTINDALEYYSDVPVLSVPWRVFGDNGCSFPTETYSVIDRFTRCRKTYDIFKKCLINFNLTRGKIKYIDPHYCDIPCIDPARKYHDVKGSQFLTIADDNPYEPIELNHYAYKTFEEYYTRKMVGSAFSGTTKIVTEDKAEMEKIFKEWMVTANEIESRYAYNFYHDVTNPQNIR